jgi:hypothetical protein
LPDEPIAITLDEAVWNPRNLDCRLTRRGREARCFSGNTGDNAVVGAIASRQQSKKKTNDQNRLNETVVVAMSLWLLYSETVSGCANGRRGENRTNLVSRANAEDDPINANIRAVELDVVDSPRCNLLSSAKYDNLLSIFESRP